MGLAAMINPELLEILRCPMDPSRTRLRLEGDHLLCERCGEVRAFEDPELERAIEHLSSRVDYAIEAHEVTLRGRCPSCA